MKFNVLYDDSTSTNCSSVIGNGLDPTRTKHMQGRGDCAGGDGVGAGVVAAPSARDAIAGNHVRQ